MTREQRQEMQQAIFRNSLAKMKSMKNVVHMDSISYPFKLFLDPLSVCDQTLVGSPIGKDIE